jgi:hypothetical protein
MMGKAQREGNYDITKGLGYLLGLKYVICDKNRSLFNN